MNTSALWCFNATGRAHVPPAADSDDRPQRFDCGKRPGLDQYGIEGGSSARGSEAQDKEVRALFKSIHQDHGAHRTDAEDFKSLSFRSARLTSLFESDKPDTHIIFVGATRHAWVVFHACTPEAAHTPSSSRSEPC
jgi:hypothetical protein